MGGRGGRVGNRKGKTEELGGNSECTLQPLAHYDIILYCTMSHNR